MVRAHANERRREWVQRAGSCAPSTPMWTSRAGWLDGLRQWAQSPGFSQVCVEAQVSITAATLLAIAAVMAEHADHATGRHVAVTRATIADKVGCDVRTVTAAWRVLRASRWAVEAQRGHGSTTTPSVGRRPSVYHLVPRRQARPALRPVVHDFHLPPSGGISSFSPVGSYSPSGRASAPANGCCDNTPQTRPRRATARPLATQKLAAGLVAITHGLDRAHIGAICDALSGAGIDPAVWSARAVNDALNADMRARGATWPDHIANPGAFLASRLRRLSWTPPEKTIPIKAGGCAADSIEQAPRPVVPTPAARARITPAREEIRRVLIERAQRLGLARAEFETAQTGPEHEPSFLSDVTIDGELLGTGQGGSKRDAERRAAEEALAAGRRRGGRQRAPGGGGVARPPGRHRRRARRSAGCVGSPRYRRWPRGRAACESAPERRCRPQQKRGQTARSSSSGRRRAAPPRRPAALPAAKANPAAGPSARWQPDLRLLQGGDELEEAIARILSLLVSIGVAAHLGALEVDKPALAGE